MLKYIDLELDKTKNLWYTLNMKKKKKRFYMSPKSLREILFPESTMDDIEEEKAQYEIDADEIEHLQEGLV